MAVERDGKVILLSWGEIRAATGVSESWFRKYVQHNFLPPAVCRQGVSGKRFGGSHGLYHADTVKWIAEIQEFSKRRDVTMMDFPNDHMYLAWLRLLADQNIGREDLRDYVLRGLDDAIAVLAASKKGQSNDL